MVNPKGDFIEVPLTCDNRACGNSDCQKHRGSLYLKNHHSQISYEEKYTTSPKAYVFTGWVLDPNVTPLEEIRSFAREKLIALFALLTVQCARSRTPFCIFMEFKLKDNGSYYLHFHVVAGSVGDIHLTEALWGRKVFYEYPVVGDKAVHRYIRKYTSKSPVFIDQNAFQDYVFLVYKLQMCRYSVPRLEAEKEFSLNVRSEWFTVPQLVSELKNSYRQRIDYEDTPDFEPYFEPPPNYHPPDDLPSCVYCPEFLVSERKPNFAVHRQKPVKPKKTIHRLKIKISESSYPKHYLCKSEICDSNFGSPDSIGALSTTKICSRCGAVCYE